MTLAPSVSVIIPVYNGERFLRSALDSVFAQTCTDYEVICIDDGSTDGSLDLLRRHEGNLIILTQRNGGQGAARNAGAGKARGRYLAFLDQDDLWYPGKLASQLAAFETDVVLVHTNVDTMDEIGRPLRHKQTSADLSSSLASPLGRLIGEPLVLPSAMMVRRDVFEAVGMFDPELRGFEDYDLIARLRQKGRFVFLEESGVRYRVHRDGFNQAGGVRVVASRERFLLQMRALYRGDARKQDLIQDMLSDCYSDWGKALLTQGRQREARDKLWLSIKIRPWRFRTWSRLSRSYC